MGKGCGSGALPVMSVMSLNSIVPQSSLLVSSRAWLCAH